MRMLWLGPKSPQGPQGLQKSVGWGDGGVGRGYGTTQTAHTRIRRLIGEITGGD